MVGRKIAYFISHHGFGHSARASAIMQSVHTLRPDIKFDIFTRAPRWFFDASLTFSYGYHEITTDVGLVQLSPIEEDLPATIRLLENFLPIPTGNDQPVVRLLSELKTALCICDISPLGIAASRAAGIPAVLVENFTWDWIYTGFLDRCPEFERFIPQFKGIFQSADFHIQSEPVCEYDQDSDLTTYPIARKPRISTSDLREQLDIPANAPVVLITMGGFELDYSFINQLSAIRDVWFIIPGGSPGEVEHRANLRLLPFHSVFYHPDLVNAANAVIGKAGYSTVAEAYQAGIPFGYVSRDQFRESPILSAFIQREMGGMEIDGETFQSGSWINTLSKLLNLERRETRAENGADQAARYLIDHLL